MAHCSVWSNATSASQKNCKTTFPKCSLCSRTRASLEMTSDRSCVSMPKNTTFSRSHASCLWVAFVVSRSCSQHHCYDGTSRMDSWWIECTKSSSTNLTPCFRRFGESVSTARRAGDEDPDKAIIADTMKLLGNSGYGKTVTNVDRHRDVKYCTEIGTSALINNKRFRQLDVVTEDAYEIEMKQECREVHTTTSHRLLRLPVRQTTHATVLLRFCRQIRRTTAVSVLRDGHRLGIHCSGW